MSAAPAFRPRPGSLARADRALLLGALALLVLLCWRQLFAMAQGMHDEAFGALFAMWVVMMIGMMVPTAVRSIMLYVQINARVARRGGAAVSGYWFAAGYVAAWIPFSGAATAVQRALVESGLLSPMTLSSTLPVAGVLLVAAGLWQLSPVKDRCLRHCRSPIEYLAAHYRPGVVAALRLGVGHGVYCLGCCWLLMSLLFVGGVMNLFTVAAITAFVLLEKLLPSRYPITRISAWLLLGSGAACLAWSLIAR